MAGDKLPARAAAAAANTARAATLDTAHRNAGTACRNHSSAILPAGILQATQGIGLLMNRIKRRIARLYINSFTKLEAHMDQPDCETTLHYNLMIDENNDPVLDPPALQAHMNRWDGPRFIAYLRAFLLDLRAASALEVGVGTGRLAVQTCGFCDDFTGIDISPKTILVAQAHLPPSAKLICGDFLTHAFAQRFDAIYSSLTWLHIADKAAAIQKTAQLLRPGGLFLLSIDKSKNEILDYGTRQLRIYPDDPAITEALLRAAGFLLKEKWETEAALVFAAIKQSEESEARATMTIRQIDLHEHLPQIGNLVRRSNETVAKQFNLTRENCPIHPTFCDDDSLRGKLNHPGVICLGGYAGDELVGFVALIPRKRRVYELTRLCVAPEQRGAGCGNRLLDESLRVLREKKARKVVINIIDKHSKLKQWYIKYGFREVAKKEYAAVPFVVCVMELKLRQALVCRR
jgi:SAM-dependent methyltransferase/predicted GNAT family N-acyltransferase